MNKSVSLTDYKINKVLGENFKKFINLLESSTDFSPFLFKNSTLNHSPQQDNDITYQFSEYLMAATAAFRQIENPNLHKINISNNFTSSLSTIFDELADNKQSGTLNYNTSKFDFLQLPFKINNPSISHLIDGFHLLPYKTVIYPKINDKDNSPLINIILYLQHYIALLDLTYLDSSTLITFLQQDNITFMKYVNELINVLNSTKYFSSSLNFPNSGPIEYGVIAGLIGIADKIIRKFKTINSNPLGEDDMTLFVDTVDNWVDKFVKQPFDIAIVKDALKLDDLNKMGVNVDKLGLTNIEKKNYNENGLLNPQYILNVDIATSITSTPQKGGMMVQHGGPNAIRKGANLAKKNNVVVAGKIKSLDFLYGPPIEDANNLKQNLISELKQGKKNETEQDNANLVTTDSVKLIEDADLATGLIHKLLNGTPNDNLTRIHILAYLYAKVENNITPDNINKIIKKNVENYAKVWARIRSISSDVKEYSNEFSTEFTLNTYNKFSLNGNILGEGPVPETKKNDLNVPEIKSLYLDHILKDPDFYSKFFNLIEINTGKSTNDLKAGMEHLQKYRLNVKKVEGYSKLNMQVGGKFGDIVLVSLVPDYNGIGGIYLTKNDVISKNILNNIGKEAIKNIVRNIYESQGQNINIYGVNIDLIKIARIVSLGGLFDVDYQMYFKTVLNKVANGGPEIAPYWKSNENQLSSHMLREATQWKREGNDFIRSDASGKVIENKPENNCAFINETTEECLDFFAQCLVANDNDFEEACREILNFNFNVNVPMTQLKEEIMKVDPIVAFGLLKQFKFGSYLSESDYPIKGFRSYKVQSVGSWVQELLTGSNDRCKVPTAPVAGICNPASLNDQLGSLAPIIISMARDPSKYPFFNYLDIFVQWVNANPQVLNPEEILHPTDTSKYPPINKSFNTYDYSNPYKTPKSRLINICDGLERLKVSITSNLAGFNGYNTISNVANIPLGINMPFNRSSFISPIPSLSQVTMYGGSYSVETELKNSDYPLGYVMFDQIYKDLISTIKQAAAKTKLSSTTQDNIQQKLERFKETEEALRKSLINLIERNKLYKASQGYINPYTENEEQFEALLKKHSNLLQLSSTYNKKAINLIDVFQTIANAVLSKTTPTETSDYKRPLSMQYY